MSGDVAAAGWGGDRYALINGPNGAYALVILTTWDTPADATEFSTAATQAIRGVPGDARVVRIASAAAVPGGTEAAVLYASDAATLDRLAAAALP